MRIFFLPLLALLVFAQSCQNAESRKAFDFNQKLAGISLDLNTKGRELGKELQDATTSHSFTKVAAIINGLDKFVDEKIVELKAMENVGGSEKLKDAMLDFLNFEKTMVTEGFGPFAKMDENTADDEIQAAIRNMTEKTSKENEFLAKVRVAQQDFATKNGFKLAPQ